MSRWATDALLGVLRVTEQLRRPRPRWTPITAVTPGMTEITASLVEKDEE